VPLRLLPLVQLGGQVTIQADGARPLQIPHLRQTNWHKMARMAQAMALLSDNTLAKVKSRQALGQEIRQFAVDRQPLLDRALYLEQHPAPRPFPGRAENPCQLSPSNKRTSIKAIDQRVCLSRRDRRIAAVVVKAPIGLFAEPPGLNILHQQRCWAIFGVARCLIKNLDDIEAGIEPNEVSQL